MSHTPKFKKGELVKFRKAICYISKVERKNHDYFYGISETLEGETLVDKIPENELNKI